MSFNPRPVISHGAIQKWPGAVLVLLGFNPRPVISHGAISSRNAPLAGSGCFNPRPVISHGAIGVDVAEDGLCVVSIRAP